MTRVKRTVKSGDLRRRLLDSLADAPDLVADLIAGRPVQTISYRVRDLIPYVKCPNCGEAHLAPKEALDARAEVTVESSAAPRDRIMAAEFAAKYTVGRDVSPAQIRDRLVQTLSTIQRIAPPDLAAAIISAIQPHWTR